MPDPVTTPNAPAAAPAAPAAPATPPPATNAPEAQTPKAQDPVKSSILSSILRITTEDKAPEAKTSPAEVKKEEPKPEPKPEPKKEPVSPAKPKVVVKKTVPAPSIEPVVEAAVTKALEKLKPTVAAPVEPAPEDDSFLTEDQREDVELAKYIANKDPAKKGLDAKLRTFYKAERDFLDQRRAAEGDDYEPETDPQYRQFLAKNMPRISAAEKKQAFREMTEERAVTKATEKVRGELEPKLREQQRALAEIKERPAIAATVNSFAGDMLDSISEAAEAVKFFRDNNYDETKLREAFPVEAEAVSQAVRGAMRVAEEYLSLKRGLKEFNPTPGSVHSFLETFITDQANVLLKVGGQYVIRDGKTFVHPAQWKPGMEATNWTFDDSDVLLMLKQTAVKEAQTRLASKKKEVELILAAQQKKTAQNSAPAAATPPVEPSVKSGAAAPIPGAASGDQKAKSPIASILNI